MTLDPKLLNVLACPECNSDLIYRQHDHQEELICPQCRRHVPIVDGIPQWLPPNPKSAV